MKKLTVNITDEIYETFKEMSIKLNIPVNKVFENYFCLDNKVPVFRISKLDYHFITIVRNVIRQIKAAKGFIKKNIIRDKEEQYKLIICMMNSSQALIETIMDKIDNACKPELKNSHKRATNDYLDVLDQVHELCLSKKGNMVKFLNLLVEEFDEIKLIRIE